MDEYLSQLDLIATAMDDKDKTPDQLLEETAYKINLARFKRDWPLLPAPPFLVGISGSFGSGKSSIICWLVNLYLQYGVFKAVIYFSESGQVDPKMKVFSPPDNTDFSYKGSNLDKELGKVFVAHGLQNPYAPGLTSAAKKSSVKEMAAAASTGGINALMNNYKKRTGVNAAFDEMTSEKKRRLTKRFAPQASKDLTKFMDDMENMTRKEKTAKLKSLISGHTLFVFDDASGQEVLRRNSRYWPFMTLIRHLKASGIMAYHEYKQSGTGLRTIMSANVTTKTGNPKEIEKIAEESGMLVSDFVPLLNSVTRLGKGNYLVNYMDGREKSRVINFKLGLSPEQIAEIVSAENAYVGSLHGDDSPDSTIEGHLANRVSNEGEHVGGTAILAKLLARVPPDRMVRRSTIESVIPEIRVQLTPAQGRMLPKAINTIKEVEAVVLPEIADPAKLAAEFLTLPVNRTSNSVKPTVLGKRPHSPPRLSSAVLESTNPGIEKAGQMLAARYIPLQRQTVNSASANGRPRPGSYASGVAAGGTIGPDSAITQILARMAKRKTNAVRQATTSALIPRQNAAIQAGDVAGALAIRARIAAVRRAPVRTLQAIAGSTPGLDAASAIAEGQARRAGAILAIRTGGKFNLPGARGGVTRASRRRLPYGYRRGFAGYGSIASAQFNAQQNEIINGLKTQLAASQKELKDLAANYSKPLDTGVKVKALTGAGLFAHQKGQIISDYLLNEWKNKRTLADAAKKYLGGLPQETGTQKENVANVPPGAPAGAPAAPETFSNASYVPSVTSSTSSFNLSADSSSNRSGSVASYPIYAPTPNLSEDSGIVHDAASGGSSFHSFPPSDNAPTFDINNLVDFLPPPPTMDDNLSVIANAGDSTAPDYADSAFPGEAYDVPPFDFLGEVSGISSMYNRTPGSSINSHTPFDTPGNFPPPPPPLESGGMLSRLPSARNAALTAVGAGVLTGTVRYAANVAARHTAQAVWDAAKGTAEGLGNAMKGALPESVAARVDPTVAGALALGVGGLAATGTLVPVANGIINTATTSAHVASDVAHGAAYVGGGAVTQGRRLTDLVVPVVAAGTAGALGYLADKYKGAIPGYSPE